jgi:hypothetical protein
LVRSESQLVTTERSGDLPQHVGLPAVRLALDRPGDLGPARDCGPGIGLQGADVVHRQFVLGEEFVRLGDVGRCLFGRAAFVVQERLNLGDDCVKVPGFGVCGHWMFPFLKGRSARRGNQ